MLTGSSTLVASLRLRSSLFMMMTVLHLLRLHLLPLPPLQGLYQLAMEHRAPATTLTRDGE